jgi:hypothetical protein
MIVGLGGVTLTVMVMESFTYCILTADISGVKLTVDEYLERLDYKQLPLLY